MINRTFLRASRSLAAWVTVILLAAAPLVRGQVRSGGERAGVGRAYEAAGKSANVRVVQDKMSVTLQRAIVRARQLRAASESSGRSRRTAPAPRRAIPPPPSMPSAVAAEPPAANAVFTADPTVDTFTTLVDSMGSSAEEKAFLSQLFNTTKTAFEAEVAKKGRQNNLAAALTFFIAASVTVYHDDPEPSDAAVDNLWDGMNAVVNEAPEYAALTDRDKQVMYDTLVALSGLALVGHTAGKQANDTETRDAYRQLAGMMIEMVLKTKPDKVRFVNNALVIQ